MPESTVTTKRPEYVDRKVDRDGTPIPFVGRCKLFPVRDALLLPFQRKWVDDQAKKRIAEKSRQIGWTWATAYDTVRTLGQVQSRDNQWDTWITSRDAEQAQLTITDMLAWAEMLEIGAQDMGERLLDDNSATTQQLRFASGLTAHSMSSNFNAQAGKRGHRVLDEFALHDQQKSLYAIAEPGITWGGRMAIFSTHRGTHSFFNQLITEAREKGNAKRFSVHRVTLQDALDQGFLYKLQEKMPLADEVQAMDEAEYFDYKRAGAADEESFQQEYMCVPQDDATAFLGYDLLDANKYRFGERWDYSVDELAACKNALFVGVDIGRLHDLTVIWVCEKVGPVFFTRAVICLQNVSFSQQEAVLYPILALPNMRRCCIDQTGMGMQFTERGQERFGAYRVEGVKFTIESKEQLAYPLRAALQDCNFRIPDDQKVFADFRAIKKIQTAGDNVRFAADRGKNGHADRFWAAALARNAGADTAGPTSWTTVKAAQAEPQSLLDLAAEHPVRRYYEQMHAGQPGAGVVL